MKDMKEPTMQPTGSGDKQGRIVELTPDMELRNDRKARIIDLTTARQDTSDSTEAPPTPPAATDPAPSPAEPQAAAPIGDSTADIEADIEAAFNDIQSQPVEPMAESDEPDDAIELVEVVTPNDLTAPEEIDILVEDTLATPVSEAVGEADFDADAFAPPELSEEDDVIELTDTVDLGEEVATQHAVVSPEPEEEEPIELTDIVDPAVSADEAEDEDIIDLVDIAAPGPASLAAAASAAVGSLAPADDDEVIELTDIVDPAELAATAAPFPEDEEDEIIELTDRISQEVARLPDDAQDQVIHLDSVLTHARRDEGKIEEELSRGLGTEVAENAAASVAEEGGIDLDDVREALGGPTELTDKELEEAIERIIQTRYAETIERHIAAAVERIVTREMESIKRSLMEDQDVDE